MSLADPSYVKDQYRDSSNLDARIALHARFSTAPRDFHAWVFDHMALRDQARVLELGCGTGELWARNRDRIPSAWQLVLSDSSLGMIRASRSMLLPAHFLQLDAQVIPFRDESFDAVVADHMLYCVPDLPRAFAEIRRALERGGKLYAATNGIEHMREYFQFISDFLGVESARPIYSFSLENGAEQLAEHFGSIERFDFNDALAVTEAEPLISYAMSTSVGKRLMDSERQDELRQIVTERIARDGAIRITKVVGMFVAIKEPCHAGAQ